MRALKIAGMVMGSPLAMLGFMLPFDGIVGTIASVLGHAHGFVIIIGR